MTSTYTRLHGFAFSGGLDIESNGRTTSYAVEVLASDWGRAFRLTKQDGSGTRYDVLVDGVASTCCCKGFTRYGRCRHVTALAQAIEEGSL
jgi:hypothetical protein